MRRNRRGLNERPRATRARPRTRASLRASGEAALRRQLLSLKVVQARSLGDAAPILTVARGQDGVGYSLDKNQHRAWALIRAVGYAGPTKQHWCTHKNPSTES